MADIRAYEVKRFHNSRPEFVFLCETHVARRKVIGYRFAKKSEGGDATDRCYDCTEAAREASPLDVAVKCDPDLRRLDRERETPEPVPVLKGQRGLWE